MTDKPKMNAANYQEIPQALKDIPHWVNWKYFYDRDKQRWTKLPLNPAGLKGAKADTPETWGTFTSSCGNVWDTHDLGIGFEIGVKAAGHSSGLLCVDLDHVLKDGVIQDPDAQDIFETLDSYTEISPGGDGLHIWIKADVTEERAKRKGPLEIYSDRRYMTVTGNRYGTRTTVEERTAEINELIEKYLKDAADTGQAVGSVAPGTAGQDTTQQYDPWYIAGQAGTIWNGQPDTDDDIIRKMCDRNPTAARLWRGDAGDDHSAADQALVNHLAFWSNYDRVTIDRLFRRSGLMRDKWDKIHDPAHNRTYGQMTIDKALAGKIPRTPSQAAASSSVATSSTPGPQPQDNSETTPRQTGQAAQDSATGQQTQEDVYQYAAAQWRTEFEDMILVKTPPISTGFPYLDMLLDGGLYPGLITLGAVTGEGKTTLGLQMMDNIAAAGRDVIIFSMEMSKFELIAKSISRLGFKLAIDKQDAFTTRQLLNYDDYRNYSADRLLLIEKAKREYFDTIAPHVFIRESPITGMGVDDIQAALEEHRQQTGAAPVVLVDYIQLMTPSKNNHRNLTDKMVIDLNVKNLKQISRDFNTPVIAISSVNRAAYSFQAKAAGKNTIDLTDFKESGAIEYSSDILLGLNKESYDDKTKVGQMALDILKNRNGEKNTSQAFNYYYRFNCLIDVNRGTQRGTKVI